MKRIATDQPGSDSAPIVTTSTTLYRVRTIDNRGWIGRTTYCATRAKAIRLYDFLVDREFIAFVDAVSVRPLPQSAEPVRTLRQLGIATTRNNA